MYKFFEGILIRSNVGNLYIVWLHLKKGNSYTQGILNDKNVPI
jgi:hypothetical protein